MVSLYNDHRKKNLNVNIHWHCHKAPLALLQILPYQYRENRLCSIIFIHMPMSAAEHSLTWRAFGVDQHLALVIHLQS